MKSLGKILRNYIMESGYTIYKAAGIAGVNRTTLQKILVDERSASEELLHKLLPILKLAPAEEAEVWKIFEISQTGEAIYKQRQYIKNMVESTASLDCFFYPGSFDWPASATPPPTPIAPCPLPELNEADSRLYSDSNLPMMTVMGIHNVEQLICAFLSRECNSQVPGASHAGSPGSAQACEKIPDIPSSIREILVSAPGNLPVLRQLFIYQLPNCRRRSVIELKHITPLIKAPGQSDLMLNNMEILSAILPFTISQVFHYEVYCFYQKELLLNSTQYAFPYYIVFSDGVILLSCDGHTALSLTDRESIYYFRNLFLASLKKTAPLISTCTCPGEILRLMIETDRISQSLHTLEYQPCFATFFTESMVQKYMRANIPNSSELSQALCLRIHQLASIEKHSCIFSKDGLLELALDGIISDFPSEYILPISIPDRILLLKALYLSCKEDRQFLRLVNPVTLSLPKHVSFIIHSGRSIDFSGYPSHGTDFNYVHIAEQGILECFEDFYGYLSKSNLVCTKEETLREIESLIAGLSDKAYPPRSNSYA